jgi:hypothetical protein
VDGYVALWVEEVLAVTAKAILVLCDGEQHWLPKSQVDQAGYYRRGQRWSELWVRKWFLDRRRSA